MTPFPGQLQEEDEEAYWQRVAGMGAPGAQAMPPAPVSGISGLTKGAGYDDVQMPGYAPDPSLDVFAQLAQSRSTELPAPPVATGPNKIGLALAFIADMMLNKGRSAGTLIGGLAQGDDAVANVNYERQRQHAKDKAALEWMARRGTSQGMDPRLYELRRGQLTLDQAREMRLASGNGTAADLQATGGLTADQQFDNKLARERFEWEKSKAGQVDPYKERSLKLREQTANDAAETRKMTAEAAAEQRSATNSGKYWNDTEFYRTGAAFLQRADSVLSKYPEGSDIPGAGMVDSRMPEWTQSDDARTISNAQNWMNNAIQRADSGAAAPIPEELAFKMRTGSNPGATEAAFREGMAAAKMYFQGQLRSRSAGMEDEARDVLRRQGIEGFVFEEEGQPAPEQPAPKQSQGWKPQNGMDYLPNKPLPVDPDDDEWEDL